MTYCVGILVDAGLVMLADSRTNAGVDNISTFHKVIVFERRGERVFVLLVAGNLSLSQSVVSLLREAVEASGERPNLFDVENMYEAARCVGEAIREVHARDAEHLEKFKMDFNVTMILGGQIKGERPRMFNIYPAGNFIEATQDTCYFQIGEFKYGKPIIDRVINRGSRLQRAAKCGLVSMDSTMRSNLTVGPPISVVTVRTDEYRVSSHQVIDADNEYFRTIRNRWGEALSQAFRELPDPDWLETPARNEPPAAAVEVAGSGRD
jgi:putative proteasome-type protease